MRADYATSDLINRVNSDWIEEVLAKEHGRSGHGSDAPGTYIPADDDTSDRRLRREFARKRGVLLRRGPTGIDRREPGIALEPIARPSRYRSVARRVKIRLALAAAGLEAEQPEDGAHGHGRTDGGEVQGARTRGDVGRFR